MSSEWWDESRRGQLMGYGVRWGNKRAHITKIEDDGPGANGIRSLCGGIQSVCMVNSGLDIEDAAACEEWKASYVEIPIGTVLEEVMVSRRMGSLCPRCKLSYDKRLARHATDRGGPPTSLT